MKNEKHCPPKFPERILKWILRDELSEEVLGDLEEKFHQTTADKSALRAKLNYWYEMLNYFRPFAIRKSRNLNQYGMFKHHLKIGWRNIVKQKSLFAINTTGLALGIATCLIIMIFVADELNYDVYHKKADDIVRVVLKGKIGDEIIKEAVSQGPVAHALKDEVTGVSQATRLRDFGIPQVTYQDNTFRNSKVAFIDANFFDVFTLPFVKGDPETALLKPNTIVITEEEALKYFGDEDPLGKILEFNEWPEKFEVTGVIEKIPENSHFHFDLFMSMEGLAHAKDPRWLESNYHTYLVLEKGYNIEGIESQLPSILAKYMGPQVQKHMGMSLDEFNEKGNAIGLFLQPLTDIHLYSDFTATSELEPGGDIKMVYIFSAIALLILLVATINFINLSTAAASKRAKEIGIKKVLGSPRKELLIQFLTESWMATIAAIVLAVGIMVFALPLFNELSGKMLKLEGLMTLQAAGYFFFFGIIVSLLAGGYPAFFLSSFPPLLALKSKFSSGGRKGIRSTLVVFQFVVSVVLIIATLVVDQQLSFIQNKDVGYDRDQILVIRDSKFLGNGQNAFKENLLSHVGVQNVTMSGHVPAGPTNVHMTGFYSSPESDDMRRTTIYNVDERYLPTMGLELIAGRNFATAYGSEHTNVIVNETFLKTFGLPKDAIGMTIKRDTNNEGGTRNLVIVGIVKDFHFKPLHKPVDPLAMQYAPSSGLIVRASTDDIQELIVDIHKMWESYNINEPFSYALLNDLYDQTYLKEAKTGTLLRIFAVLTILVACLGLFGLVTFAAERRYKEIGIRKILGSSVFQIIAMLSVDFLKLIMISFIIAFPLGFYLMNQWLQNFASRIDIHWWILPFAGAVTILIASLTVSFKSMKTAMNNPVNALKDE